MTTSGEAAVADPTARSSDGLAQIGFAAATLFERLRWPASHTQGGGQVSSAETLEAWARLYARGDAEALRRRMAWDGIDEHRLERALRSPAPGISLPSWTAWLPRLLSAARALGEELRASGEPAGTPEQAPGEPAFAELWVPFVRVAREELSLRAAASLERLGPEARSSFEAELARGLAAVGELALLATFRRGDASWWRAEGGAYRAFVVALLQDELTTFLEEYPVLAYQWVGLVEAWVAGLAELLTRLEQDEAELERVFGIAPPARVVRALPALSDRHHGGRQVMSLELAGGRRLVYKPRGLGIEAAWHDLLAWCEREGLPDAPPSLRLLERGTHGWVEHVGPATLCDAAAVERYFRSAGALVCLSHLLGARDLHAENVIALTGGPVLVDAEMVLAPMLSGEPGAPGVREEEGPGAAIEEESCLLSGLLTHVQVDESGEAYDMGGLQPSRPHKTAVARRVWHSLRTSDIGFSREAVVHPVLGNQPSMGGRAHGPEEHASAVCAGFAAAYRFMEQRRQRLLGAHGPLAAFRGTQTRLLVRPSSQYGALLYVTCAPQYQRHGVRWSLALDSINRVVSLQEERPRLWPLAAEERDALEHLDIPRFTVAVDSSVIETRDGVRVEGALVEDGLSTAWRRIMGLSGAGLARQMERLNDALSVSAGSASRKPVALATAEGDEPPDGSPLVVAARQLGHELLARGERSLDRPGWVGTQGLPDLYRGAAGPAVFLAALGATTGDSVWRETALDALAVVRDAVADGEWISRAGLGIGRGLGSVAYALGLVFQLVGDERLIDWALRATDQISPDRIAQDEVLDVEGGVAGALMALLAVHKITGEPRLLDAARLCGERLLTTQTPTAPEAGGWPGPDGRVRAGFAHGTSGIASALVRLHAARPDGRLLDAARRALRHERSLFSAADGNWPALNLGTGSTLMVAWCHGAPGVGLARALTRDWLGEPSLDDELAIAMRTTASAAPSTEDHLCCGNLGRSDALLTAGRALGLPGLVALAEQAALRVAERVRSQGRQGARVRGFEVREFHSGFFQGYSGIGYQLLRTASPEQLPSVLAFETRGGVTA